MFLLIVDKFWGLLEVVFGCFDWLSSLNEECCIKECWVFRGDAVKSFQNPCFGFGHNLAITHPT